MHNRLWSILAAHNGCATPWINDIYFHHLEDITVYFNLWHSNNLLFQTWSKLISVNFLSSLFVINLVFFYLWNNHWPVRRAASVWGNGGLKRIFSLFHDLRWIHTVNVISNFQDKWYRQGQTLTFQQTLEFLSWRPYFEWTEPPSVHYSTLPALGKSSRASPSSRPGPSRRRGSWAGCRPCLFGNTARSYSGFRSTDSVVPTLNERDKIFISYFLKPYPWVSGVETLCSIKSSI